MSNEVLVKVDGVGKKFCRSLKKSLLYGVGDIARELVPFPRKSGSPLSNERLRPGEFWAVDEVSFELRRGECLGLIGRNGAGKTTLLKMLNGLIKPDRGRIEIRGRVGALIALGAGFNPILSGRENIYVNGSVLGLTKKEIDEKIEDIIDFADIRDFIDTPVQSYSSGMQVRLGFAVATALEPDVLLLDEVLAVGDAAFRVKCFNRIDKMISNTAVIFVSHNMPQVTRICNTVLLMDHGAVIDSGNNLGNVISKYHQTIFENYESTDQGSGDATIEYFQVLDENDNEIQKLRHGDPFKIKVRVRFRLLEDIRRNPRLLVTVADGEGTNIAQILEPIDGDDNMSEQEAIYCFDSVLFNAGSYVFTASILLGERGELASVRRNIKSLIVEHDITGYAPILLTSKKRMSII